MYSTRIKQWKINKNYRAQDKEALASRIAQAHREKRPVDHITYHNRPVKVDRILRHFNTQRRKQRNAPVTSHLEEHISDISSDSSEDPSGELDSIRSGEASTARYVSCDYTSSPSTWQSEGRPQITGSCFAHTSQASRTAHRWRTCRAHSPPNQELLRCHDLHPHRSQNGFHDLLDRRQISHLLSQEEQRDTSLATSEQCLSHADCSANLSPYHFPARNLLNPISGQFQDARSCASHLAALSPPDVPSSSWSEPPDHPDSDSTRIRHRNSLHFRDMLTTPPLPSLWPTPHRRAS